MTCCCKEHAEVNCYRPCCINQWSANFIGGALAYYAPIPGETDNIGDETGGDPQATVTYTLAVENTANLWDSNPATIATWTTPLSAPFETGNRWQLKEILNGGNVNKLILRDAKVEVPARPTGNVYVRLYDQSVTLQLETDIGSSLTGTAQDIEINVGNYQIRYLEIVQSHTALHANLQVSEVDIEITGQSAAFTAVGSPGNGPPIIDGSTALYQQGGEPHYPFVGSITSAYTDWYELKQPLQEYFTDNAGVVLFGSAFGAGVSGGRNIDLVLGQPVDPDTLFDTPEFLVSVDFKIRGYLGYDYGNPPTEWRLYFKSKPELIINGCPLNYDSIEVIDGPTGATYNAANYLDDLTIPASYTGEWLDTNATPSIVAYPVEAEDQELEQYPDQGPYAQQHYIEITLRVTWKGINKTVCKEICTEDVIDPLRQNTVGDQSRFGCYAHSGGQGPIPSATDIAYGLIHPLTPGPLQFDRFEPVTEPQPNFEQDCTNAFCLCQCPTDDCTCEGCDTATVDGNTNGGNTAWPIEHPGTHGYTNLTLTVCKSGPTALDAYLLSFDEQWPYITGRLQYFPQFIDEGGTLFVVSLWGTYTDSQETEIFYQHYQLRQQSGDPGTPKDGCEFTAYDLDYDAAADGGPEIDFESNDLTRNFEQDILTFPQTTVSSGFRVTLNPNPVAQGTTNTYTFSPDVRNGKWYLQSSSGAK